MSTSPDPTAVPSVMDLAKVVKTLGGTPATYMPQGPEVTETFTKAALASAVYARAAKVAQKAQADLAATGAVQEKAALTPLLNTAMEEGDDRLDAVPLTWYWQITNITSALHAIRETARMAGIDADPLIKATADTSRALMILLEARLNLKTEHLTQLTHVLAEAEEMLTSARSNTARLPQWIRKPGNLG